MLTKEQKQAIDKIELTEKNDRIAYAECRKKTCFRCPFRKSKIHWKDNCLASRRYFLMRIRKEGNHIKSSWDY